MNDLEFYPVVHYAMVGMPSWATPLEERVVTLCRLEGMIDAIQRRVWKGKKKAVTAVE